MRPAMTRSPLTAHDTRQIRLWLLLCAAMVFVMVILGGATRLTESGLSMVEWQPLTILPPITETEWQVEFEAYQRFPEFQKVNSWMTVDDFKNIYWLEYIHRLWGRLIGVVFAVPFIWLLVKGRVHGQFAWTLAALLALGGAQGVLGWFMVASGLVDRPDVSQYHLAAHLVLAFAVYGLLIWVALGVKVYNKTAELSIPNDPITVRLSLVAAVAVLLVVVSGAFVAGLNAGLIYNTFPLMNGQIIPDGLYDMTPWYLNGFENIMTVQFNHRILSIILVCLISYTWWRISRSGHTAPIRSTANIFLAMAFIQSGLGISTLVMIVPTALALAHQAGALILYTLAVIIARMMHPTPPHAKVRPSSPALDAT